MPSPAVDGQEEETHLVVNGSVPGKLRARASLGSPTARLSIAAAKSGLSYVDGVFKAIAESSTAVRAISPIRD